MSLAEAIANVTVGDAIAVAVAIAAPKNDVDLSLPYRALFAALDGIAPLFHPGKQKLPMHARKLAMISGSMPIDGTLPLAESNRQTIEIVG